MSNDYLLELDDNYLLQLIKKYKKKGVFVDSGLLLPFIVGSSNDLNSVRKFGRTANFDENDFDLIEKFIDYFDVKITSPHVLTEVSDLLGERDNFHTFLGEYINLAEEIFLPSKQVMKSEGFLKFGLADSAILEISKNSYLIFTADNPFYGYLKNMEIDVINFDSLKNSIRVF